MDDLRASLEFFPEVIRQEIVVGQDRWEWLGVKVVIQGLANECWLRGIKVGHGF
jgi:hypothetical protein